MDWFQEIPEVLQQIHEGLRQAKAGQFADNPPDLDADADFFSEEEKEE